LCKRGRFACEAPGCHHEAPRCAARSHDAIQLTHRLDADFVGAPLFALHKVALTAAAQHKINAAVRSGSAGFLSLVASDDLISWIL